MIAGVGGGGIMLVIKDSAYYMAIASAVGTAGMLGALALRNRIGTAEYEKHFKNLIETRFLRDEKLYTMNLVVDFKAKKKMAAWLEGMGFEDMTPKTGK